MHVMPVAAPGPAGDIQYLPGCDCGWTGPVHIDQQQATDAAVSHARQATAQQQPESDSDSGREQP